MYTYDIIKGKKILMTKYDDKRKEEMDWNRLSNLNLMYKHYKHATKLDPIIGEHDLDLPDWMLDEYEDELEVPEEYNVNGLDSRYVDVIAWRKIKASKRAEEDLIDDELDKELSIPPQTPQDRPGWAIYQDEPHCLYVSNENLQVLFIMPDEGLNKIYIAKGTQLTKEHMIEIKRISKDTVKIIRLD